MEEFEDEFPIETDSTEPLPFSEEEPTVQEETYTDPFENEFYEQLTQKDSQKQHRSPSLWMRRSACAALALAVVAGSCTLTASSINRRWEAKTSQMVQQLESEISALKDQIQDSSQNQTVVFGNPVSASGEGLPPSQVYAQNVNSVVAISAVSTSWMMGQPIQGTSTGSGFILTEDGYVVTNYHVVEDAESVSVITNDQTERSAQIVGFDRINDVAVLKVEAENLPAVKIGSSDNLIVGDMVVAIGNPLGKLTATQTVGYVSGKNREVTTDNSIINMIQTDAAINSGNSGGPLFNIYGEVVGITTAKYSGTSSSGASIEGIGFAIPIDDVMEIIRDLMDYGYVTGAYLGVTVKDMDSSAAAQYGLPMGAYVTELAAGHCAERAGVQPKDIIVALGDYTVANVTELTRALRHFKAGDTTTITVVRAGQSLSLNIQLDEKPQDLNAVPNQQEMPSEGDYDEWYDYFRKYFDKENNAG